MAEKKKATGKDIEKLIKALDALEESFNKLRYSLGTPMFWDEYLEYIREWDGDEWVEKVERVKEIIEENNLYGMTGKEYQRSEWYKKIKEEVGISFTMRAWGNLMASLMNTKEGERKYIYLDFAW